MYFLGHHRIQEYVKSVFGPHEILPPNSAQLGCSCCLLLAEICHIYVIDPTITGMGSPEGSCDQLNLVGKKAEILGPI